MSSFDMQFLLKGAVKLKPEAKTASNDQLERRTEVIRQLCQGRGVFQRSQVTNDQLEAFGVSEPESLVDLLRRALFLIPSDQQGAIENALGGSAEVEEVEETLTERRNRYIGEVESRTGKKPSYRTVIRHEQEGAKLLAQMTFKVGTVTPAGDETLEGRIGDLEVMLLGVTTAINEVIDELRKGKPFSPEVAAKLLQSGGVESEAETQMFDAAWKRVIKRYFAHHMHHGLTPSSESQPDRD